MSVSNGTDQAARSFDDLVDELTQRMQAGRSCDLQEYAAAWPDHAERLRQLWPAMQMLAAFGRSDGVSGSSPVDSGGATVLTGELGDFRIRREIGRGGMGVVYEAEQISLGRRVALKVLPFAAMLDERQLQRFKNEARAAAGLHHTNIVPVYSVGCERGVHYYAMQCIEGQTLADVIDELRRQTAAEPDLVGPSELTRLADDFLAGRLAPESRPPDRAETTILVNPAVSPSADCEESEADVSAFAGLPRSELARPSSEHSIRSRAYCRTVARLGVQIAEALDYAHGLGVIHRDVKPSNLLLDARGTAWITDFGLARIQADASLTVSGDILGTLRYMSPEQALGRSGFVDHRTDIYSLGVTLYELLTLQPAITGGDHQEILHSIAFEEPRRPRQLNKSVPADLEMIVLKAMAREPGRRYATAQELADDLRRFLAGQAVHARPAGLLSRVRLWCRHPERVRDAGTFLILYNLVSIIWHLSALTAFALGGLRPERPAQFLWFLLWPFFISYLPLLWLGIAIKKRKLWALWSGAALSLLMLACGIAYVATRFIDLGGVYNEQDPGAWFALQSLLIILDAIQVGVIVIALVAWYANRKMPLPVAARR